MNAQLWNHNDKRCSRQRERERAHAPTGREHQQSGPLHHITHTRGGSIAHACSFSLPVVFDLWFELRIRPQSSQSSSEERKEKTCRITGWRAMRDDRDDMAAHSLHTAAERLWSQVTRKRERKKLNNESREHNTRSITHASVRPIVVVFVVISQFQVCLCFSSSRGRCPSNTTACLPNEPVKPVDRCLHARTYVSVFVPEHIELESILSLAPVA